jgi:hypothetical protein
MSSMFVYEKEDKESQLGGLQKDDLGVKVVEKLSWRERDGKLPPLW